MAIGIDLGTTNSCVAVFQNGKVEIIANEHGERTTPSYVAFADKEKFIGNEAKNRLMFDPTNVLFDVKRILGKRFDDTKLQSNLKYWPFRLANFENKPKLEVKCDNTVKQFYPEEISSMLLTKMKQTAEDYLGHSVKNVVITVPAYFDSSQRKATKDAGLLAGLDVLQIINEPTAAAIAYGFDKKLNCKQNLLIYDLGGGTLDISILAVNNSEFTVKATSGDTHLGGEDFNNCLVDHFVAEFEQKHKINLTADKRAIRRLCKECERAKHKLSFRTEAKIEIDLLSNGLDFVSSITRAEFEHLCGDLFKRTIDPVVKAMTDAELKKWEIDEIIMVGGSSRIPKLQNMLINHFDGRVLNKSINPDEAVAYGAAIQAAKLKGDNSSCLKDLQLNDVVPLSIGIETVGGLITKVIKRNTTLPAKSKALFTTSVDDQSVVVLPIYEGESVISKKNKFLGELKVSGIPLAKRGIPNIEATLTIDNDDLLKIDAYETTGKIQVNTKLNYVNQISNEELQRLLKEAEINREEDERQRQNIEARNELQYFIFDLKDKIKGQIDCSTKENLLKELDKVNVWLKANSMASKKDFDLYKEKLKTIFKTILL